MSITATGQPSNEIGRLTDGHASGAHALDVTSQQAILSYNAPAITVSSDRFPNGEFNFPLSGGTGGGIRDIPNAALNGAAVIDHADSAITGVLSFSVVGRVLSYSMTVDGLGADTVTGASFVTTNSEGTLTLLHDIEIPSNGHVRGSWDSFLVADEQVLRDGALKVVVRTLSFGTGEISAAMDIIPGLANVDLGTRGTAVMYWSEPENTAALTVFSSSVGEIAEASAFIVTPSGGLIELSGIIIPGSRQLSPRGPDTIHEPCIGTVAPTYCDRPLLLLFNTRHI